MLDTLLDPLFRLPMASGLLVTISLSLIGPLIRLRDEWLAALGFAHLAGVSALLGLALHWPPVIAAPLGAMLGALTKGIGHFRGNTPYAVMILLGWAGTLLIASNTPLGSVMGHALVEGQIFFANTWHLYASLLIFFACLISLPWLTPRLLRARFLPQQETASQLPAKRWHTGFDVLVALSMAIGTGTIGLMGAFALVLLPAWSASRLAKNWRHYVMLSVSFGALGYLLAFTISLIADQPFGPTLVMVLLLQTTASRLFRPAA